ncbi:4-alpha-L-fucosyltransferase [Linnemannia zychae]|nr:4-alpha-L-fucosyltransferase [Linnemannia zychae]
MAINTYRRIIAYIFIALIAILLTFQLYITVLKKNSAFIQPQRHEKEPEPPFIDIHGYCNNLPLPRHSRGVFFSDRTASDGPIKIFYWKQMSWNAFNQINWEEEEKKLCPFYPGLQSFFDNFAKTMTRDPNRHWTPGYAPCYFWTTFDGGEFAGTCQTTINGSLSYTYTTNYTEFSTADVVVFNYPFLYWKSSPPYFDSSNMPPRLAHQKWILHFYDESIGYYPHIALPAFLDQFDLTVGSPPSLMDIPHPIYPITQEKILELANSEPTYPFDKTPEHYIAFMISNCETKNNRNALMKKLIESAGAHSYGSCINNIKIPDEFKSSADVKRLTLAPYPFGLASENSNCVGYITEKIYDVYATGAIPVYNGASDIADFVPEGSFINVSDFATYDDLIKYLKTVDRKPFYQWKEVVKKDPSKFCKRCFAVTKPIECAIMDSINFV